MATLASFEGLLKEVVNAKRLSASRMNSLTDMAMALMENDIQLISILYRTHKTLSPSSKIHSLYTFDALSRAARSKVNKLGLSGDINAEKGNCATFLLKVDGILDSLIHDMMSLEAPEAKEKTKKILDIWTKNSTFSPSVLARLADIAKDTHKDANTTTSNNLPTDPRAAGSSIQEQPTPTTLAASANAIQAQALLQALLTSAVSSAIPATRVVTGSAGNQIGTNAPIDQVALLQQLVEKAKSNNGLTSLSRAISSNDASIVSPQNRPVQSIPPLSSSYNAVAAPPDPSSDIKRGDPYANIPGQRYFNSDKHNQRSPQDRSNHDDARHRERPLHWRGGFGGRGGGRGGRGWGEFDDRGGPPRRHRSRSKSPPRFGGRGRGRDIRPYSPLRRPSLTSAPKEGDLDSQPTASLNNGSSGKDEFGRDIRPSSNTPEQDPYQTETETNNAPTEDQREPIQDYTSFKSQSHTSLQSGSGLEKFDFTVFDFSSPAAWEALGNAWRVTHGILPSQEQLMQFLMEKMSQGNPMLKNHTQPQPENNIVGDRWGSQQQQQQLGRSIPTYESGSNLVNNSWEGQGSSWGKEETAYDYEHGMFPMNADTDAVVLGGDDQTTVTSLRPGDESSSTSGPSSRGGAMKRIGDRWVWQRS